MVFKDTYFNLLRELIAAAAIDARYDKVCVGAMLS